MRGRTNCEVFDLSWPEVFEVIWLVETDGVSSPVSRQFFTSYPQCGKPSTRSLLVLVTAGLFDATRDFGDLVINGAALLHELTNLLICIHDCRVVTITEELADFW